MGRSPFIHKRLGKWGRWRELGPWRFIPLVALAMGLFFSLITLSVRRFLGDSPLEVAADWSFWGKKAASGILFGLVYWLLMENRYRYEQGRGSFDQ